MKLSQLCDFLSDSVETFLSIEGFHEGSNWGVSYQEKNDDDKDAFEREILALMQAQMHIHNEIVAKYLHEVKRLSDEDEIDIKDYVLSTRDKRLR